MSKFRIFVDSDVLFAASASSSFSSASVAALTLAEVTTIDAFTCETVIVEVTRNLERKMPDAVAAFRLIVQRSLHVVSDPDWSTIAEYSGKADAKDLPILVAAKEADCLVLLTFNVRHFQPGVEGVEVMRPGQFIQRVRHQLSMM